jgi:hypothetical protein
MRITDLQNLYREKQGLLQRLRTPRKKSNLKGGGKAGGVGKMRGPGRPKKKTFPNPRAKMGRPRKQTPSAASVAFTPAKEEEEEEEEEDEEEDEEGEEEEDACDVAAAVEDDSSSPPVLERQGSCSEAAMKTEVGEEEGERGRRSPLSSSDLIRPPRLSTADSSPPEAAEAGSSSTSLSTLTSKFMQGKANPFANLLSQLATTTAGSGGPAETDGRQEDPDEEGDEEGDEEDDGVGMEEEGESGEKFASEDSSSEASTARHTATAATRGDGEGGSSSGGGPSAFKFGKTSKLSYCLEAYRHSKKRKAERPKKNSGRNSEYGTGIPSVLTNVVYI